MKKITKAVVPCGGMGTRFLPITKAVPKEILPVVDTPVLGYIVDEAVKSGITDVLIVLGKNKEAIREYFSPSTELEEKLRAAGKDDYADLVKRVYSAANVTFTYQSAPRGNGDAVYCARSFTGDEPFCLAWGDDLIAGETPVMGQLAEAYYRYGAQIIGVQEFPGEDIVKYGVAKIAESEGRAHKCLGIVEKPALKDAPSRYGALGRYALDGRVYGALENTLPGKGGEIQLTDALNSMCAGGGVYAYEFEGKRYDMGDKFGAVTATVEFALASAETGDKMKKYILDLAASIKK